LGSDLVAVIKTLGERTSGRRRAMNVSDRKSSGTRRILRFLDDLRAALDPR
jgi:hypothetical protein